MTTTQRKAQAEFERLFDALDAHHDAEGSRNFPHSGDDMEKRKITITVSGQTGIGKSSVMTFIERALREAGLADEEITQVNCSGEEPIPMVKAHQYFPGDHPDGTYEVEIRELRTHPGAADRHPSEFTGETVAEWNERQREFRRDRLAEERTK